MTDAPTTASDEIDCPHCGAMQHHDDDFCHECGHAFSWRSADAADELEEEQRGQMCPMCDYGEVVLQSDGIRQCDRCGYTARDWPEA